jgi:hypothetical protein
MTSKVGVNWTLSDRFWEATTSALGLFAATNSIPAMTALEQSSAGDHNRLFTMIPVAPFRTRLAISAFKKSRALPQLGNGAPSRLPHRAPRQELRHPLRPGRC